LTKSIAAALLQSVIGGIAENFYILPLGDRVFRFLVSSQTVVFYIYKLCYFECLLFKFYFNLWHGGRANYMLEFRGWQHDEAKNGPRWEIIRRIPLTGANAIPVSNSLVGGPRNG
jgi:hypothetical protein